MSFQLETPRILLRELTVADASVMYELNGDPEVIKYTGDDPFSTIEEAKNFLKNYADYRIHGMGRWGMVLKSSSETIGWCGLKKHKDGTIDLGFRILKNQWGNGYSTEASYACLKYGFETLKIEEVIGRVLPENGASVRVLEKVGMTYWKTGPCDDWNNALYYRISYKDFRAQEDALAVNL